MRMAGVLVRRAARVSSGLMACGALLSSLACARRVTIILDHIPNNVVSAFDRTRAVPASDLRITSLADGAVIPRNHAYPLVEWRGARPGDGVYLLALASRHRTLDVYLEGASWRPTAGEFDEFLADGEVRLTLYRSLGGAVTRGESVGLMIAERTLAARIAFRVVQPLFDPTLPNALEAFTFGRREPEPIVELADTCVGCHAYTATSAFLNVKRFGDRRMVTASRASDTLLLRRHDLGAFSFFAVSPDGAFAAYVKAPVGDLVLKDTPVEPFDYPYRSGDIFVYETATGATWALPGASDPESVEDMPAFSPDGARLLFSRYRVEERNGVKGVYGMELAEVPFNGGRGGTATTVPGTAGEGLYSYFARYSPNGKWISVCRGDGSRGVYARRSSDIYLMPAGGGAARRLRLNADGAMDSWHAWSPDSHWLAFSSNRETGGMTALYLAYVDDAGNDAPPIKLVGFDAMKVNTPQFVPGTLAVDRLGPVKPFIESSFAGP